MGTNYIYQTKEPEIAFAWATSTFPHDMTSGYPVSAIDSYLENSGAELSMTIQKRSIHEVCEHFESFSNAVSGA